MEGCRNRAMRCIGGGSGVSVRLVRGVVVLWRLRPRLRMLEMLEERARAQDANCEVNLGKGDAKSWGDGGRKVGEMKNGDGCGCMK